MPRRPTATRHARRFLALAVIGGGPTGVEMAGAIAELARAWRCVTTSATSIRARRVSCWSRLGRACLAAFSGPVLSASAHRALERLGVEVRLGTPVTRCGAEGVTIGDDPLAAATIVWAAGGRPRRPRRGWVRRKDRVGRVMVGPDFSLPGHPEIFCIGDTAHAPGADGQPLPGLAPVADQQGAYVARAALPGWPGSSPPKPFPLPRLRHHGHDRQARRRGRLRLALARRHARLAAGAPCSRVVPGSASATGWSSCSTGCAVLRDLPVRRAVDHRSGLALARASRA